MPNSPAPRSGSCAARKEVATCAISGAVGTFAQLDPRVEATWRESGPQAVEPVSTQIIPRDRHAMYFATLGVVASSVERLATEIRHLQRTEVLEAEEYFSAGPKRLLGDAAQAQSGAVGEPDRASPAWCAAYVTPALENVALWHERDISHSSVERMIGPDATVTLDFALTRLAGVIDRLRGLSGATCARTSTALGGLVHSQRVLLALTQKGVCARGRLPPGAAQRHARFPR